MNNKLRKRLAVGLLGLSLSGVVVPSFSNVSVYADIINSEFNATYDDIGLGSLLANYINLEEKDGITIFSFNPDLDLSVKLLEVGADFTVEDLNVLVSNLNDVLINEKGQGIMANVINEIKEQGKVIESNRTGSLFRISACSATFFGAGLLHSGMYTLAATALGVTGVGAAYGAGGLLCP